MNRLEWGRGLWAQALQEPRESVKVRSEPASRAENAFSGLTPPKLWFPFPVGTTSAGGCLGAHGASGAAPGPSHRLPSASTGFTLTDCGAGRSLAKAPSPCLGSSCVAPYRCQSVHLRSDVHVKRIPLPAQPPLFRDPGIGPL